MTDPKKIYAQSALRSLPRILSLMDRNPFSQTYGCMHRDYWLYKTSDFPDAVRQFGVHALALSYAHEFPTPDTQHPTPTYYQNPNLRDWAIAGLRFWASIQHTDGSFDEFYPYERGWVGPTAFTTYASSDTLRLLRPEMSSSDIARVEKAIRRAAHFIAAGDHEEDHLANHHAMAFLAVSTAADVLQDDRLREAAQKLWQGYLRYHSTEGWSREYDGADPGYLSASVSFLAKVYACYQSVPTADCPLPIAEMKEILTKAVEFCSYFVMPDGSYAGTIGSRNTLHFYPHGFELLSREMPLAAAVADRLARGLAEGKLVPPEIMSDRYVHYRVPEYLLAAIDAGQRPAVLPQLPYERPPFVTFFPEAKIATSVHGTSYTLVNLAKGGVVRSMDRTSGSVRLADTGWIGELTDGRIVTSQCIDPEHVVEGAGGRGHPPTLDRVRRGDPGQGAGDTRWMVRGTFHQIPAAKLFTIPTNLIFRTALLALGWYPKAAHWLKGKIRKSLILGHRPVPCIFERVITLVDDGGVMITDTLENTGRLQFRRLLLGGDFPVRYVPQSRFFQAYELNVRGILLDSEELRQVNGGGTFRVERIIASLSAAASS